MRECFCLPPPPPPSLPFPPPQPPPPSSVIGIPDHRIAIIDLPLDHPDFPAVFETCCRESYVRVVLCTQYVGVSQTQGFRDEVMRVGSGTGRDM